MLLATGTICGDIDLKTNIDLESTQVTRFAMEGFCDSSGNGFITRCHTFCIHVIKYFQY